GPRLDSSLQIVYGFGSGQRLRALGALALRVQRLGARERLIEAFLRLLLGLLDGFSGGLAAERCGNALPRGRPRARVFPGRTDGLLERRDLFGARSRHRRHDAERQSRNADQRCRVSWIHVRLPHSAVSSAPRRCEERELRGCALANPRGGHSRSRSESQLNFFHAAGAQERTRTSTAFTTGT